jgi:3-oxoacyl-[acyl-carrier-protein] synthase-3
MGAHIETAVVLTSHGVRKPNARRLADTAAAACLAQAGREPGEVDILINTGLYREDNLGEPALAALVQEDIGASPGHPPVGGHGTFSFDLINGTCGVINAIQIEAGMLRSGVVGLGAIVASDVDPDLRGRGAALFRPAGGAMLLSWDDGAGGFTDYYTETFPEYAELFVSGLVWQQRRSRGRPAAGRRAGGRARMVVEEKPGYHDRLADCAEESVRRFLDRAGMSIGDIDLLVPAPSYPDFCDPLRLRLGVPGDRVAYVPEDLEGAYTAGPIAALQAAIRSGRLGEARTTLMLAAGAGITVAIALYRQPGAR